MPKKNKKKYERKILKRLVSWNVNGIRAVANKEALKWIDERETDILCLQEIKALPEQIPEDLFDKEYLQCHINSAEKKGYSGVCVLTKEKPLKVIDKTGIEKFDCEGRTLILEYKNFVLFNCYFPNGQRDHGRVDFKLEYYKKILSLYKKYIKDGKNVIITGDFNCTPNSPTLRYFAEQGFVFVEKGEDNLSFQGSSQSEIDHLIYRNTDHVKFEKKSIRLLNEHVVSDHRPLIVELEVEF